jgi:hypothetical protein
MLRLATRAPPKRPRAFGHVLQALVFQLSPVKEVALLGDDLRPLEGAVRDEFSLDLVLAGGADGRCSAAAEPSDGRRHAAAYVCELAVVAVGIRALARKTKPAVRVRCQRSGLRDGRLRHRHARRPGRDRRDHGRDPDPDRLPGGRRAAHVRGTRARTRRLATLDDDGVLRAVADGARHDALDIEDIAPPLADVVRRVERDPNVSSTPGNSPSFQLVISYGS